jgi:vancomycin permeability regulator SanA
MKKKAAIVLIIIFLLTIIFLVAVNFSIKKYGQNICTADSTAEAALVLGAKVYDNGRISPIFQDRIDTALDLYEKGSVKKILISGDHGRPDYDEVNAAKDYFLEKGVKAEDIFLDHAGFDTYDSVYRARDIFVATSLIVVTQDFHLARALYIADKLGIDACGASADLRPYVGASRFESREYLARIKAFFNVIINSEPKFLGEQYPLSGAGQATWD